MYKLLGICLVFSTLLWMNTLTSVASSLLWRILAPLFEKFSAVAKARLLFWLRVVPVALSFVLVVFFLVPSYIAEEPRDSGEIVSLKLAIAATVSASGIVLAIWRGLRSWLVTRQLLSEWLRGSHQIKVESVSIPAYCIDHQFPIVAVVGSISPKLFIARKVIDSLTTEELTAALAHETGHVLGRDNLKRGLLRACRDVLTIVPCGRLLDSRWSEAAEAAADEFAANAGKRVALDLASALVKIARLVPEGATPIAMAGALLIGDNLSAIAWRVRRLTELASVGKSNDYYRRSLLRMAVFVSSCACLFVLSVANYGHILLMVHNWTEQIVSLLQ